MKKEAVIGIFLVLFLGLISATPYILFVNPTPTNNSIINQSLIEINYSLTDINASTAFVDFNNSLIAWYRFNNESGENENYTKNWAQDDYHGVAINSPEYVSAGVFGGAFNFSQSDFDYFDVSYTNNSYLTPGYDLFDYSGNQISLEAWIKWNNLSYDGYGTIIGETVAANSWVLRQYDTQVDFYFDGQRIVSDALNDGEWHHIVAVYTGSEMQLWVDGILNESSSEADLSADSTPTFKTTIGCLYASPLNNPQRCLSATIDEVRVWNRALSIQEIKASYNATLAQGLINTTLSNGNYSWSLNVQNSTGNVFSSQLKNFEVWTSPKRILNSPLNNQNNLYRNTTLNITVVDYEGDLINVTFLNSTNGTICQENNIVSGSTVICEYQNLEKEVEYLWSLNITDGTTTTFKSQNFTVGISWEFTENYDNKKMSFVWTSDDWDGDSTRYKGFMNASDMAQRYGVWFSPGTITSGYLGADIPIWSELQSEIDQGYITIVSHSRNHLHPSSFTLANATLEANGSKNDIELNLTLPIYNHFNSSEEVLGWLAPFYEVSNNLTIALNLSNYLVHRSFNNNLDGGSGWGGFNESTGFYHDQSDISFSQIEDNTYNYTFQNYGNMFDDAYEAEYQFHLMGHPGRSNTNWTNNSVRDVFFNYSGNWTDVWYVGWDHAYMYRYMTNQSLPTVNVTSNPEEYNITLKINASSEDRDKYALSYPLTYEISVPSNWTDVYIYYKNDSDDAYTAMENKTRDSVWNGVDAYRKDLDSNKVYVSKAFPQTSNDLYLLLRPTDLYPQISSVVVIETVVPESVGGSISYTVTETKLQEGQVRQLREGAKVKLEFSRQGTKILEVVFVGDDSVKVKVGGVEVEIANGTTEKIDVNDDEFYDLEVSVQDISSTGSARLMFKEIYEEIVSDVEEGVEEEVKEEEDVVSDVEPEKRVWVYFVIGGIVLIGFVVFFVLFKKKK